jgi:hypothetical protein
VDNEARRRQAEEMVARRRHILEHFVAPTDEMTALDLMLRTGEEGETRAYVALMVNANHIVLSRAGWEFILPQLLRLVYGGRFAEAGIAKVLADLDPNSPAVEEIYTRTLRYHGALVLDPHPLELAEVGVGGDGKRRSPEEMRRRLRRQGGDKS